MADKKKEGAYHYLFRSGELSRRAAESKELLRKCVLCPHECSVDRSKGKLGLCRSGSLARVASYCPHFGEESVLVGEHGSGTIFFSGCNLRCVFCQNYEISHPDLSGDGAGDAVTAQQLSAIMLELQAMGCHNINLVTPSHVVPQILEALVLAVPQGLSLPLVYNSSGYDSLSTLGLLDGVVDIYMPDCKFMSLDAAGRYTAAKDYPERMCEALREMNRQVGVLQVGANDLAEHGLLVRHLLMPGGRRETELIFRFLAEELSTDTYLNIMDQYRPCGKADQFAEIASSIGEGDYAWAMDKARAFGLHRLDEKDWAQLLRQLFT
ncbi:MAG: radical SAM protein [Desulfobulbaceae bacterium]|nr:radical SAM protein [Desulfobulbaceae bacterium]